MNDYFQRQFLKMEIETPIQKSKYVPNKCEHGKNKYRCKTCGGTGLCVHGKQKYQCVNCGGKGICIHGKHRFQCKDCKGNQFCEHLRLKRQCKDCKGSQICTHNNIVFMCKICSPNSKYFCKSCKLFTVRNTNNYLCSYCNPEKKKRQKTKELKLKTWIDTHYSEFIYNKKVNMNSTCQLYYPDFLKDCGTFFLIIECDENAHSSYPPSCERIRENNIVFALGLPCVFIRYNPDYKGISEKLRYTLLKSYIDYYLSKETSDNEVIYLFY